MASALALVGCVQSVWTTQSAKLPLPGRGVESESPEHGRRKPDRGIAQGFDHTNGQRPSLARDPKRKRLFRVEHSESG